MRVIAGSAGSIPLYEVRAGTTRPMTDRAKTSLFSVLAPRIPDAEAVDLFAGTGSLGIEALSRGAAFCTFVERDRTCLRTIARNLERTRLADRAHLIGSDVSRGVRRLVERGVIADLVFFDPPFRMGKGPARQRLMKLAAEIAGEVLGPDGVLIYHHEFDTAGELGVATLATIDQRRYGRNVVTIFRKTDPPPDAS